MTHWTDGMSPCVHCKALTRDKVDGVPMCNDCEDERICQFGHLHATPEGATGCQRKQDAYITPPRATGEGARDDHADMQSPVDRPGSATDSASTVVASDRPASARDETGQAVSLQQLRGSAENAADTAPVAVSLGLPEALAAFIDIYDVVFDEDDVVMLQAVLARLRGEATVRPSGLLERPNADTHVEQAAQDCLDDLVDDYVDECLTDDAYDNIKRIMRLRIRQAIEHIEKYAPATVPSGGVDDARESARLLLRLHAASA